MFIYENYCPSALPEEERNLEEQRAKSSRKAEQNESVKYSFLNSRSIEIVEQAPSTASRLRIFQSSRWEAQIPRTIGLLHGKTRVMASLQENGGMENQFSRTLNPNCIMRVRKKMQVHWTAVKIRRRPRKYVHDCTTYPTSVRSNAKHRTLHHNEAENRRM